MVRAEIFGPPQNNFFVFVLQSTYLYFISNEDQTFEKKNVSYLPVTSTLRESGQTLSVPSFVEICDLSK